jgi:hypothetical protein
MTAREALAAADAKTFDLRLSDIGLPDETGWDLLEKLRAKQPTLRAVAVNGFVSPDEAAPPASSNTSPSRSIPIISKKSWRGSSPAKPTNPRGRNHRGAKHHARHMLRNAASIARANRGASPSGEAISRSRSRARSAASAGKSPPQRHRAASCTSSG